VIEAGRLFDIPADRIDVVVHPESIIHSMVRFVDGSIKAQMSMPDMRMPIRYALGWPERIAAQPEELDLAAIGALHFERPDLDRFPCLQLAYDALRRDGTAPTVLNAANEVAVAAFLDGAIGFTDIPRLIADALADAVIVDDPSLHDIIAADKRTRENVRSYFRRPEQGSGVRDQGSGKSDDSSFSL
jgi:1-deoxy-D-xylulose-5-phosphate reductoisomerase